MLNRMPRLVALLHKWLDRTERHEIAVLLRPTILSPDAAEGKANAADSRPPPAPTGRDCGLSDWVVGFMGNLPTGHRIGH